MQHELAWNILSEIVKQFHALQTTKQRAVTYSNVPHCSARNFNIYITRLEWTESQASELNGVRIAQQRHRRIENTHKFIRADL